MTERRSRSVDFGDTENTPLRGHERCAAAARARRRSRSPRHSVVVHDHRGNREVVEMVDVALQAESPTDATAGSRLRDPLFVITCSVWFNCALFIAKTYVYLQSHSLAVLASVVDSLIDLLAQAVLMFAKQLSSKSGSDKYPVGRSRLEPVGVVVCAVIMGMASVEVVHQSFATITGHWGRTAPHLHIGFHTFALLITVILLKTGLWAWSSSVGNATNDESVKAVAQDNRNDVLSNVSAIAGVSLTLAGGWLWLADPVMGIGISIYIIYTWLQAAHEQVDMLVGRKADTDFLARVQQMAEGVGSGQSMSFDSMEAYHFGPKYLVELEMVMPEDTPLVDSHDAGMRLQHLIEKEEQCERCFVHIDYQSRVGADGRSIDHNPGIPLQEKLHMRV
eukprot:TRINITY_DN6501_c0_g1_i1.p1 TRINITY_DN6501_c0_g1~~TRINITY_DN6501_c0_g1_i1.p1  ORF type:complete len:412 (+),score=121.22 TRINITY_DN6501_c0_g1_i1:61-1236(+)